ncbi:MAG TPA: site-2 protease family protein [Actinomycetota bacterium]
MTNLRFALYLAASLVVAMDVREFTRSAIATRAGDPTPRLWGRRSWNPRSWFDPFGSGLLPGLILVLWAAGASFLPPPVAYAKPAPVDPNYFRNRRRDTVVVSLAGPIANLALAGAAGLALRVLIGGGTIGEVARFLVAFELTNLCLLVFHLLPIPGLDGARIVALFLPPRAAEVYRNADQYLPLFVLAILFVLGGPLTSIVYSLTDSLCRLLSGFGCTPL